MVPDLRVNEAGASVWPGAAPGWVTGANSLKEQGIGPGAFTDAGPTPSGAALSTDGQA